MLCQGGGGEVNEVGTAKCHSFEAEQYGCEELLYYSLTLGVFENFHSKNVNKQSSKTETPKQQRINRWLSEYFITVVQAT